MDDLLHEACMPTLQRSADDPEPDGRAFRSTDKENIEGKGERMQLVKLTGEDLQKTLGRMNALLLGYKAGAWWS